MGFRARPTPWTTSVDAYRAGQGVCRDFAHLGITFCRALNIPARYVFGYIPDIDAPASRSRWISRPGSRPTSTAAGIPSIRATTARAIGRVVVGRGRDAVDVALITSFGQLTLTSFEVRADRVAPTEQADARTTTR